MYFLEAEAKHIPIIQDIVRATWPVAYAGILSEEQSGYMMNMMYTDQTLKEQMEELGHHFLLGGNDHSEYLGFVSFEFNYRSTLHTKIHKLYILPQFQGMGLGQYLIEKVAEKASGIGNVSILLNVNRYNKALNFYKRLDFNIIGEEDINIGKGFLMEDYILEKRILDEYKNMIIR